MRPYVLICICNRRNRPPAPSYHTKKHPDRFRVPLRVVDIIPLLIQEGLGVVACNAIIYHPQPLLN